MKSIELLHSSKCHDMTLRKDTKTSRKAARIAPSGQPGRPASHVEPGPRNGSSPHARPAAPKGVPHRSCASSPEAQGVWSFS